MATLQQVSDQQISRLLRGIKRHKSHYKKRIDEANWDDRNPSTLATFMAHGCEPVTYPTYVPKDQY